ncbi:MAG: hypothetical protein IKZ95_02660 [Lachnospiraceae bacterium]|nr:hypothetical protein [Lachnospiraceae bacterium]
MGKAVLAVFDSSREYVDKFLSYVKKKRSLPLEVVAFTDDQILFDYLSRNHVCALLYSQEDVIDQEDAEDTGCEKYIGHPNVGEFIYFGTRRNSKSRLKHINKYQSMEKILAELEKYLNLSAVSRIEDPPDNVQIYGIYAITPCPASLQASIRLAAGCAAAGSLLYIDLDRFPLLDQLLPIEQSCSISDLLYFYKINREQLKEILRKTVENMNGFDLLGAPLDMEDVEAIPEEDWPAFLQELSVCGEYDMVMLDMHEAFRDLEGIFSVCSRIYVTSDESSYAKEKMKKLKEYLLNKGREDLVRKMAMISTEELGYGIDR